MSFHSKIPHIVSPEGSARHARPAVVRCPSRCGGFSLVELVTVITVVGIIFSLGSVLLGKVFNSYALKRDVSDADWQAKVALERMTRELRAVRNPTGVPTTADLDITSAAQVRFIDTDNNGVCFYRDAANNRLMRSADGPTTACGTTNPQVLADNISALNFTYWGNTGAATATVASVYYITESVTLLESSYNAGFRATVRPRNF